MAVNGCANRSTLTFLCQNPAEPAARYTAENAPIDRDRWAHRSDSACQTPIRSRMLSEIVEGAQDHKEVVQLAVGVGVVGDGSRITSDLLHLLQQSSFIAALGDLAIAPLDGVLHAGLDHHHVHRHSPGGHPAGVAVLGNLGLDLLQHVVNVTFVAFRGDVKGRGIAVVGRGAALLGIDGAQLRTLLDQGNLHGAVGAEEGSVLAVLIHIDLDVLGDPGLSAGNTGITGGIGSGGFDILNAQLSAALFHLRLTAGDGGVAQVPLEGDVHEGLGALLGGLVDDGGAHGDFVSQQADVGSGGDDRGILRADAGDEQDVIPGLLDLVDGGGGAGNSLDEDNGLDVGISGHVGHSSDGLLGLGGEVVGVSGGDDHVAVLRLHVLSSLVLFLTLGNGTGDDADLEIGTAVIGAAAGGQAQDHGQRQDQAQNLVERFHLKFSSLLNEWPPPHPGQQTQHPHPGSMSRSPDWNRFNTSSKESVC